MTIHALTVGKNEESRYLRSFLTNAYEWADSIFFYDDQSTDDTALIAQEYAEVRVRMDGALGFSDDEGVFRQNAWWEFEAVMHPQEGDWVFVVDCDELVVASDGKWVAEAVEELCDTIDVAYAIAFQEVFGVVDGVPQVRVDGFWGQGFAPRLFPYHPNASFAYGKVGVPAVPSYVMSARPWRQTTDISVMHYGYANEKDWQPKYNRYKGLPGHHPDHIESIIGPKTLVPWGGHVKDMAYGNG